MKNKAALFAAWTFFALTTTATAQSNQQFIEGNGNIVKEKRMVAEFTKLNVAGPFDVILSSNDKGVVTIEGSDNITKLITTTVNDGTLNISLPKDQKFKAGKANKITIRVPIKTLSSISLVGAGRIVSRKTLDRALKISLDGSGSIELHINSPQTNAYILGSGCIILSGTSQTFIGKIIGSGTIRALDMDADSVEASVIGSGGMKLVSNTIIKGRVSGTGSIGFAGNPKEKDLQRSGLGKFYPL